MAFIAKRFMKQLLYVSRKRRKTEAYVVCYQSGTKLSKMYLQDSREVIAIYS